MNYPWKNSQSWKKPENFDLNEKAPAAFEVYNVKVTKGHPWQTSTDTSLFRGPYSHRSGNMYAHTFRRERSIQYVPHKKTWAFCLGESSKSDVLAEVNLDLTPEKMLQVDHISTRVTCELTGATLVISLGPSQSTGYSYRDWLGSIEAERLHVTSADSGLQEAVGEYLYFLWPPCSLGHRAFRHADKPATHTIKFAEGKSGLVAALSVGGQDFVFPTRETCKANLTRLESGENFVELHWGPDPPPKKAAAKDQPIVVQDEAGEAGEGKAEEAEGRPVDADWPPMKRELLRHLVANKDKLETTLTSAKARRHLEATYGLDFSSEPDTMEAWKRQFNEWCYDILHHPDHLV